MSTVTEKFKDITAYDLGKFLNSYTYFVDNYYGSIVNYYRGEGINKDAFNYFDTLVGETKIIDGLWSLYSKSFYLEDFWELLETYETIKIKLQTVGNLSRWLRSSRTDRFTSNTVISYVQKQGESIERITQNFGSTDRENDWAKIAIDNDLNEERYSSQGGVPDPGIVTPQFTRDGGVILQIRLLNNSNFDLKNIVDTLSTNNLYGKDIQKKFTLVNSDLVVLSGEDALMQTFETIMLTVKGSIPEFPGDGISNDLVGSNVNVFNYPSVFRNLMNMFQKDDRFSELTMVDIFREDDNIFLNVQAKTKIGKVLQQNILV